MKITEVVWTDEGVYFVADGVSAITDSLFDLLNMGVTCFGDVDGGARGYWADALGWKNYTIGGRVVAIDAPCEDPIVIAECRLRMAVMGFGVAVPGVEPRFGPRPVMSIAEAKAALRSGAWGFEKILVV